MVGVWWVSLSLCFSLLSLSLSLSLSLLLSLTPWLSQVGVASSDKEHLGRFRQLDEAEIERHLVAISERD